MDGSVVVMLRGKEGRDMAYRALNMINAAELISAKEKVLVKPNITTMRPASTGITTDPTIVEGVIKFLRDQGVGEIAIGEGGGCDVTEAYREFGFKDIASRYNVQLIDVNREEGVLIRVPQPRFLPQFWIAKPILGYDCLISVPKLKTHAGEWKVTLSMKNMMGILAAGKRGEIHHEDRGVVDLLQVIKPDLTVIDGLVAGEGHELYGDPVKMDLVIAGRDFVATDAVGTAVMGFSLEEIPRHIRLASELGLGTCDLSKIQIIGDISISEAKRKFKRAE